MCGIYGAFSTDAAQGICYDLENIRGGLNDRAGSMVALRMSPVAISWAQVTAESAGRAANRGLSPLRCRGRSSVTRGPPSAPTRARPRGSATASP